MGTYSVLYTRNLIQTKEKENDPMDWSNVISTNHLRKTGSSVYLVSRVHIQFIVGNL